MGILFTDKFSLLHFASGIIVYYWNISLHMWLIFNIIYEYAENTKYGIYLINKIKLWPGGKDYPDTIINRFGDIFYGLMGWIFTHYFIKFLYGKY